MRLPMNKSAIVVMLLLGLAVLAQAYWIWQFAPAPTTASVVIDASNAGIELEGSDARVIVQRRNRPQSAAIDAEPGEMLRLEPGVYDIGVQFERASDGQTRWIHNISLEAGQMFEQSVEFDYGEINVEAEVDAAAGEVVTYVFNRGDHGRILTSMRVGEPVLVAPGIYDLRVVLVDDSEEAGIHWQHGVPVKSGLQTRVRVPFRRGTLAVEARNGDSLLPPGAVELSVYRAGDAERELVVSGLAGNPLSLATGFYDIAATFVASHDRPVSWLRGIEIKEGEISQQSVTFASGTIEINARLQNGDALERFEAYAYFYPVGDHREAQAYVTPPDPAVLSSGRYDVRVSLQRSQDRPDVWIRDLWLPVDGRISKTVEFASGRLLLRAFDKTGNELFGDSVFVYVYANGARQRPLFVSRSGRIMTLKAGSYDLRVEDSVHPENSHWLAAVPVDAGAMTHRSIEFEMPAN